MDKRFIEESFPVKEVSEEAAHEKYMRHRHISTFHIWWASRPLASSRATNYAALIPNSKNVKQKQKIEKFIANLCKWNNSNNKKILKRARNDILDAFNDKKPKILDPFSGRGSIPLEALRLGCETYASDYNPVAVLIEKGLLEYPQKFGKKLIKDLKKYHKTIIRQVKKEIGELYKEPNEEREGYFANSEKEKITVGYIWARTIKCQNPNCGAEIPLIKQYWLRKKSDSKISLFPYVENNCVKFKIVGDGYEKFPPNFDPKNGTVSRAIANCLVCGSTLEAEETRAMFHENKANFRLIAIIYYIEGESGKRYRLAEEEDYKRYKEAKKYLKSELRELEDKWNLSPIPNEKLNPDSEKQRTMWLYGMPEWGDLFNYRQKLSLITFIKKIKNLYHQILKEEKESKEYAKAIITYLALGLDMMAAFWNTLARWENTSEAIKHLFSRHALPMMWDYVEANPFSDSTGSWETGWMYYIKAIKHCSLTSNEPAKVKKGSATNLPYPDNYFDAVFTDPPYYDNINYAELSDFFYVWLKRTVGDLYPGLFATPLVPKSKEVIANPKRQGGSEKAKDFFEKTLKESFKECYRVLKPGGIATIVYAHKTTEGWETVINALIDSGLNITASWPIATEMKDRLLASDSAALASSIYIVAKKIKRKERGIYPEVKKELKRYLNEKLSELWKGGIAGVNFFIAAIGSAIEIFGKYEKIIDYEGNVIRGDTLLEDIRKIVSAFTIKQITQNKISAKITPMTRFYLLWRWNFQEAKVEFDEAKKLSQSIGIKLDKEWNKGFIKKGRKYIRVLGPQKRNIKDLEKSNDMIDVLHHILLLWEKGENDKILEKLSETYGDSDVFYKVAQAISQTLSNKSKEKKLIDGFLSGKEKMKEKVIEAKKQKKMEDYY